MEYVIGTVLVIDVYAIVYYRLLVKFFYEKDSGIKENTLGAIFSIPPYSRLSPLGKKYAKRYYIAIAVMAACMTYLAFTLNLHVHRKSLSG